MANSLIKDSNFSSTWARFLAIKLGRNRMALPVSSLIARPVRLRPTSIPKTLINGARRNYLKAKQIRQIYERYRRQNIRSVYRFLEKAYLMFLYAFFVS